MECSLPGIISKSLRTSLYEEDSGVPERCSKCGFRNIKPPKEIMVTYLARQETVLSYKSAVYERKFDETTVTFREAALKLKGLLYDWLSYI